MRKLRKALAFAAKLIVSVACIVVLARKIDPAALGQDFAGIRLLFLIAALGQFALLPLLGGYRWHVVLEALDSRLGSWVAIRLFWIGMMFSQVLPSISGGDAVRVVMTWQRGVRLTVAMHSVILERVAMVSTLIIIVGLIQAAASYELPGASTIYPMILAGTVVGLAILLAADRLLAVFPPWRITQFASQLAASARKTFGGRSGAKLSSLSVIAHLNTALGCLWLGMSLGIPLRFTDYLFYVSLVTLISTLPLSIGGWGVREGVIVLLFSPLGIATHTALAFSVLLGLSIAAVSLVGILFVWKAPSGNFERLVKSTMPSLEMKNS